MNFEGESESESESESETSAAASQLSDSSDMAEFIHQLETVTADLRRCANQIITVSLVNVVGFVALVFLKVILYSPSSYSIPTILYLFVLLSMITSVIPLLLAYRFQRNVRTGQIIEEEVSEELQWRLRKQSISYDDPLPRTPINIRLALRRFTTSTQFPLANSRRGASYYIILNIAISAATLVTLFTRFR